MDNDSNLSGEGHGEAKATLLELDRRDETPRDDLRFTHILDIDFRCLEDLDFQDRIPVLARALVQFRTSPVPAAMALHLLEVDDGIMVDTMKATDKSLTVQEFIDEHLPETKRWSPQKISEHRIAGKAAYTYMRELDEAGVSVFATGIIKKLYHLEAAVQRYDRENIVFETFARLRNKDEFIAWAEGKEYIPEGQYRRLEAYFDVCTKQRKLFCD